MRSRPTILSVFASWAIVVAPALAQLNDGGTGAITSNYCTYDRSTQASGIEFSKMSKQFVGRVTRAAVARACDGGGAAESGVSFSAFPNYGPAPLTVQFSGQESASDTTYRIDFGDGSPLGKLSRVLISQPCAISGCNYPLSASHRYSSSGTYTARLYGPFSACIDYYPSPCNMPPLGRPIGTVIISVNSSQIKGPAISSFSPSTVSAGGSVTVIGSGFTATGNDISFADGRRLSNISSSDGAILTFTVPLDWFTPPTTYQVGVYVSNVNGVSNNALLTVTTLQAAR